MSQSFSTVYSRGANRFRLGFILSSPGLSDQLFSVSLFQRNCDCESAGLPCIDSFASLVGPNLLLTHAVECTDEGMCTSFLARGSNSRAVYWLRSDCRQIRLKSDFFLNRISTADPFTPTWVGDATAVLIGTVAVSTGESCDSLFASSRFGWAEINEPGESPQAGVCGCFLLCRTV